MAFDKNEPKLSFTPRILKEERKGPWDKIMTLSLPFFYFLRSRGEEERSERENGFFLAPRGSGKGEIARKLEQVSFLKADGISIT